MEKQSGSAKPKEEDMIKYVKRSISEYARLEELSDIPEQTKILLNRVSRGISNGGLFEVVSNMPSTQVPTGARFYDDVQYSATMAIVEAYASYMFVRDKFKDILDDENKFAEIKPTPEQQRVQEKFLQSYGLYVGTTLALKRLEHIDDTNATVKMTTMTYKKMAFSFDKVGNDMDDQIKNSFIDTLTNINSEGRIKSSEDYAVIVKGLFEALKEKVNYEKQDGAYKNILDIVSKESFTMKGVTFRGFDKAEKKGFDVGNWPKLEMVIGMDEVKNRGKQIINKLMTYNPETHENTLHPGEQKLNIVGDSGVGKGFCITALCRYAVETAEILGKPINVIMFAPDKFKTSYMNDSANNLVALFEELYDPKSINIGVMEEADSVIPARDAAKAANRQEDVGITGAFLTMLSTTRISKLGNWMMFFDTNNQISDPAVKSRTGEVVPAKGAETPDDFIKMFKDVHLREGTKLKYLKVSDSEWKEIGELCSNYHKDVKKNGRDVEIVKLNGRDVENICSSLKAYANNFAITMDFLKMPQQKQKEYLEKNMAYNIIDKEKLAGKITDYMTSLKEANDREARERKQKLVQQWIEMDEASAMYEPTALEQFKKGAAKYLPEKIFTSLMIYLPSAAAEKAKEDAEKEKLAKDDNSKKEKKK